MARLWKFSPRPLATQTSTAQISAEKASCSATRFQHRTFALIVPGAKLFDGEPGQLGQHCEASNRELIASLREGRNSAELHRLTYVDFLKGRMSEPKPPRDCDLASCRLVPRFAVEQGCNAEGNVKVRPVDHFSWSCKGRAQQKRKRAEVKAASVNGH